MFHLKRLTGDPFLMGGASVVLGGILRTIMAHVMFLQADEEIFGYDSYYFILGRSAEFLMGKIGAYIGYPFVLSLWYRLFGVSLFSARMYSVLCSVIFIGFVFATLYLITKDAGFSLIGSLILSVLPFPLRYGHIVLSEPMTWALLSASVFFSVLAFQKGRWYLFTISGILAVIPVFVRRSALIMVFIMVPTLLWTGRMSLRKALKETASWVSGFLIPLAVGIAGFFLYFGMDRLRYLRWTRIPHVSSNWDIDLSGPSPFHNALYTLQPTLWKGLPLALMVVIAGGILLMSLHRNRWRPVLAGAVIWPAMAAVLLHGEASPLTMARIMVLPSVVLFMKSDIKRTHGFYLALSLLLGSAVAFSTITLQGDLWNVVIYTGVGAVVLLFLDDRMDSVHFRPVLWFLGILSLFLILDREPRLMDLAAVLAPVAGMTYLLGAPFSRKAPAEGHLVVWGLAAITVLSVGLSDPLTYIMVFYLAACGILLLAVRIRGSGWRTVSFILPPGALLFAMAVPSSVPHWGTYLPVLGTIIFISSSFLGTRLLRRVDHLMPLTGSVMAFILLMLDSGSILAALIAAVTVGALSTVMRQLRPLSLIWKMKVGERISVLLFMLVVGYLAFYVYYAWTEVYMSEFILQAALLGGLLIWVLRSRTTVGRFERKGPTIKRIISRVRVRRRVSVLLMIFILLSVPLSVSAFLRDDWFVEESMDKRPYMRTIFEISEWIEDNTDEDEKILAWHCYALQADRETIIIVSNAEIYSGTEVVNDMEKEHVNVFVRDWYTDHGIWEGQPYFQNYILEHFTIDRIIDGNECWIRVS